MSTPEQREAAHEAYANMRRWKDTIRQAATDLREIHTPDPAHPSYCVWCDGKDKWPCEHIRIADSLERLLGIGLR